MSLIDDLVNRESRANACEVLIAAYAFTYPDARLVHNERLALSHAAAAVLTVVRHDPDCRHDLETAVRLSGAGAGACRLAAEVSRVTITELRAYAIDVVIDLLADARLHPRSFRAAA